MARRVRQNFPQRARRQPTSWTRFTSSAEVTVAAAQKAFLVNIQLGNPGIGETVRRTRGMVMIQSDQTAADELQFGALGFVVVNDIAAGVGATAIPGPVTDDDDDGWFVWQPVLGSFDSGIEKTQVYQWDSKAMRRIEEGFQVAVMFENASATTGLQVSVAFSMLTSFS